MKRRYLYLCLLLILAVTVVACDGSDEAVELGDGCAFAGAGETAGETFDCGQFSVPVNYDEPDGTTIDLTYIVLRATGDDPQPDPVVALAGGPGQTALLLAQGGVLNQLREERDLIFMAQRGTLFGQRLAVEECVGLLEADAANALVEEVTAFSGGDAVDRSLPFDQYLDRYSTQAGIINDACYQAFDAAGFDPAQFTTLNSARDVVGLLEELEYDSYNLYGVSYGTRLALEIARNFPESGLRSIVLDSPATPSADRLISLVRAPHDALLRLFEDCANDEACNEAYPDLTQRTADLLAELETTPIETETESIGVVEVVRQLFDLGATRANFIPRMITELEAGETATYIALRDGVVGTESPETASGSHNWDSLVRVISTVGVSEDDMMGGLAVLGDMVAEMREADTADAARNAMLDFLQSTFEEEASLPTMLDLVNQMPNDEIDRILAQLNQPMPEPDPDFQAQFVAAFQRNNAQFLLTGIVCHEEVPFSSLDNALAEYDNLDIPQIAGSQTQLAVEVGNCTNYPMPEPPEFYNAPVESDVPTLILQGEFDLRTPLANGQALAEELSNATLVIVPEQGHEVATISNPCEVGVVIDFITDPATEPDTGCVAERAEVFSLPDDPLPGTEE